MKILRHRQGKVRSTGDPFNKYFLSTSSVPGIVLCARDIEMNGMEGVSSEFPEEADTYMSITSEAE